MKTPLRGEMLRGADFIIAVVNAGRSDPIPTASRGRGQASGARGDASLHATAWLRNSLARVNRHVQDGRFATGTLLPVNGTALECAEDKSVSATN